MIGISLKKLLESLIDFMGPNPNRCKSFLRPSIKQTIIFLMFDGLSFRSDHPYFRDVTRYLVFDEIPIMNQRPLQKFKRYAYRLMCRLTKQVFV